MGQDWSEIWLQKFSGTVTIWPKTVPSDFYHILSDPSPERLARMLRTGQQSTFPKIQFIKNRLKIELAILDGLHRLSPSGAPAISPKRPFPLDHSLRDIDDHEGPSSNPREGHLNHDLPDRASDYSYGNPEFRFSDASDAVVSAETSSVDDNDMVPLRPRNRVPGARGRRGSVSNLFNFEEMRRQSAVFFDDPDLYRDGE